jgi:hypothetical protein
MNLIRGYLAILPLMGAFLDGCASEPATPACSDPARLEGHLDPKAPGVFIAFKPGVVPVAAAAAMAQKYHFNIANQYSWGTIFTSNLDLDLIPSVRCERDVDYVEFNAVTTIAGTSAVAAPRVEPGERRATEGAVD